MALGADHVYETYKQHGDVWGAVGKEVVEITTAAAADTLMTALIATPVGWVALAGVAITEGIIAGIGADWAGTNIGKWLGDESYNAYEWAKQELRYWF